MKNWTGHDFVSDQTVSRIRHVLVMRNEPVQWICTPRAIEKNVLLKKVSIVIYYHIWTQQKSIIEDM